MKNFSWVRIRKWLFTAVFYENHSQGLETEVKLVIFVVVTDIEGFQLSSMLCFNPNLHSHFL